MPTTLSKGYKLPLTGERTFWSSLEFNIQLNNSHKHDGTDGEQIVAKDISKPTANLSAGSWTVVGGGTYKQTVTVPAGYLVDNINPKFYITSGGQAGYQVHPTVRKVSSTTFDVFTNDNTVGYTIIYG
jgi:hypothetical protein